MGGIHITLSGISKSDSEKKKKQLCMRFTQIDTGSENIN